MASRSFNPGLLASSRHLRTGFRSASAALPQSSCFQGKSSSTKSSRRHGSSFSGRNFLTLRDYSREEVNDLLWIASDIKSRINNGEVVSPLAKKVLTMIFQKRSTRTRTSTESGMSVLGGHAIALGPDDMHLGVNETVQDTGRVLSRITDGIFARVYGHDILEDMATTATVPIINGLSELYHPLQSLADFLTLQEHYKSIDGMTMAWVGDGNNIIHSLMMAAPRLGVNLQIATPKGYEADSGVVEAANKFAKECQTSIVYTNNPKEACSNANVIVTDTWISMGQEDEKAERMKTFEGFQVTKKLTSLAADDWCFLHCLPRKPEEVDDEVFYSDRSLVWQEAENRKWTVMAVLWSHLVGYDKSR